MPNGRLSKWSADIRQILSLHINTQTKVASFSYLGRVVKGVTKRLDMAASKDASKGFVGIRLGLFRNLSVIHG
jgi:hypothetical protein